MIVAITEHDNICGRGKNCQRDRPSEGQAKAGFQQNRQASLEDSYQCNQQSPGQIRESVLQIFDTPYKTIDVLANTVVESVFGTTSLNAILDLRSGCLKPLPDATPNTKLACIWETDY